MEEVRRYQIKEGSDVYSRYRCLDRIVYEDGVEAIESPDRIVFPKSTEDKYIKVKNHQANRLDLIAYEEYNTPRLWWAIAIASNILDPFSVPEGTLLRIPPLVTVLSKEVL